MRLCLLVTTVGFVSCASLAAAADKTIHDQDNGFSLTFPEKWTKEPPSGEAMLRLVINSGDPSLTCMVSASLYNTSGPGSPADPRKFIEDWSMNTWKAMIGRPFSTADFSNDKLARFPDGYPVRLADVDFTVEDKNVSLHGHSRFAFSVRGARFGYVNCAVISENIEQVEQMWAPLAEQAERVVSSFVLDAR
ncbi:hypothetical protein [Mesorhizobium sp. INR15]|uniref:hypothetical protein n=1 Tax=Mesorhizobium sp. INR15 TaxID=2654248 RepID=UPI00189686FB|nr:hypothetical protein [Mesorhizobium sp. INR15]QPC90335.1 hypothetical protein GA829_06875 [Mesorhizobium sp. INR15]